MKWACLFLMVLCANVFGSVFCKDARLVEKLREKNIQLIVFRHNESNNNTKQLVLSSKSPGYALTEKGFDALKHTAEKFVSKGVEAIYTSPLYRSLQTTQILGESLRLPPEKLVLDHRLVIQSFGLYEGRSYEEYQMLFPNFEKMLKGHALGGEPGSDVFERSRALLWNVAEREEKVVLLVTHAFNVCHINMCLTGEFGDLPKEGEYVAYDFNEAQ